MNKINKIMSLAIDYAQSVKDFGYCDSSYELYDALETEVYRIEAELAEAKAKLATLEAEKAEREKQKPVTYQYLFKHPAGGKVWRSDCSDWNGQHFLKGRPLYLYAGAKE